jgi:hypothetical protein
MGPDAVLVELYAQPRNGEPPVRQPMNRTDPVAGSGLKFANSCSDYLIKRLTKLLKYGG